MANLRDEVVTARSLMDGLRRGEIDRREFLLLAAGLSASALVVACGGSVQSPAGSAPAGSAAPGASPVDGGQGARKRVPLYTTESNPTTLAFYASAIAAFQADFPDVDVPITIYSEDSQLQYLTTALQNGTDLGIFQPNTTAVSDWAEQGFLADLTPMVQSIGEDDFLDGTRFIINGKDWAMPYQANASVVYYRKDLLDKAGISEPKTYDEYLGAVRELNGKDGIVGIASALGATPTIGAQFFTPYLYQSGWDYYSKDGTLRFDQPEALEAVKRYVAIMENTSEGFYNAGFGDILTAYVAGQAAFATYPGRLGVSLETQAPQIGDLTGVMRIPAGPFMTGVLHSGISDAYAVYSKTANPDEALAFLESLTTGESGLAFSLTVPGHLLPPLKSVADLLRASDDPYVTKHADWMKVFLDLVPTAMHPVTNMGSIEDHKFEKKLSNLCPWQNQVWTSPPLDGTMLQEILINKKDPEQAWTETAQKLGEIATAWKAEHPDWTPPA